MLKKGTSTSVDVPYACPHCLSNQCYGPQCPLKHLPWDFMSAEVLGPFSWCGFVLYLSHLHSSLPPWRASRRVVRLLLSAFKSLLKRHMKSSHLRMLAPLHSRRPLAKRPLLPGKQRLRKKNRNRGGEVSTEVTGTVIEASPGGSSFKWITKIENTATMDPESPERGNPVECSRGVFQSPEPKSTLFGGRCRDPDVTPDPPRQTIKGSISSQE